MYTLTSSPNIAPASASEVPHCPAPVSVARRVTPSALLKNACGMAVFGLWLPAGLTPSYL